jgi:ABC-type antimicrobial peptide transport system permease subunit
MKIAGHIWAVVVIVVATLTAVVVLAVTDSASDNLMLVIGMAVVPTITTLVVSSRMEGQISDVKTVSSRMERQISDVKTEVDGLANADPNHRGT